MIDLHFRKAEVKMLKITKVLSMEMEENELSNDEFRYIDLDNSQEYCQMILFTGSIVCVKIIPWEMIFWNIGPP